MDEQIDLATITDLNQLKALAYDRLASIEQLQSELQALNSRIAVLAQIVYRGAGVPSNGTNPSEVLAE